MVGELLLWTGSLILEDNSMTFTEEQRKIIKEKYHISDEQIDTYERKKKEDEGFNDIPFSGLNKAKEFDQSYLDPSQPGKVQSWHIKTLDSMQKTPSKAGKKFFSSE